jgi:RNA polymerase sigma-70 factor (ECF subfamily)
MGQSRREGDGTHSGATAEELELVERHRQGDDRAFDEIFERYHNSLLGFLTRMCGDPEDARESLQDTFLSVFRYLSGFRGEASLKNWVFRIAVSTCLKKKRKGLAAASLNASWQGGTRSGGTGSAGPSVAWPPDDPSLSDPEALYLRRELRDRIVEGVASMPYIYKVVINLRDFEGFSTEEVSRMLGIRESTVKVRLHRARLRLREWLKGHDFA